jgi:hypothetical protein
VHGIGGIGKTMAARWLIWRPEVKRRFPDGQVWVTLGSEPRDAATVVNDCASQLDPTLKTKATVEAARADLAALLQDSSVLFVIDDVWLGNCAEVAKALMVPSPRSRFLLTTRFPQLADDPEIKAENFPLDEMNVDQAESLIVRALGRDLREDEKTLAERLCGVVGGHPLALELAAARVREGRPWDVLVSDLSAEIARLEALEETDDDLIAAPIGSETKRRRASVRASLLLSVRYLNRDGQRLFAWLGVVAEDAIITPRMAATLWSEEEAKADKHLRTLNAVGLLNAKGDGYSVHDLMHDLAREQLAAPETTSREGDVPGFGLTLQVATHQFLERYKTTTTSNLWHTLPDDGYIHNHLVRHFEQADWDNELEGLLWEESADGHCGWYQTRERLAQTAGFLADVGQVWSYADRLAIAAPSEEIRSRAIALELHCALIVASINSLSAGVPAEVVVGAVRYRVLSLPSALALERQHPDRRHRVEALLALAGAAPQSDQRLVLGEALTAARGFDETRSRAWALTEVAQRMPTRDALVVARGIDDAFWRAKALAEVAQRLPAEEQSVVLGEALAAARSLALSELAEGLAEVACRLPAEERRAVLGEALSVARGIESAPSRVLALREVARRLPPDEALGVAQSFDDAFSRAKAMAEVADRLPAEERLGVLGEALVAARSIDYAEVCADALTDIAKRLPAVEQPGVSREALGAARSIDDANSRARALAKIGEWLPADEALATARGIDDAFWRAKALAEIAQRLPSEVQPDILTEALTAARSVDFASLRALALAELAQGLPAEDRPGVFREALTVAQTIDDAESCAQAQAEISKWLPADEALLVARGIDYVQYRADALASVARRLPAGEQPGVLGEALNAASAVQNAYWRAWALAEVAQRLPAQEALATARGIDGAFWRAKGLAEVADRLPAEERSGVLDEALTAARSVIEIWQKATALMEVAQRLPAQQALAVARSIEYAAPRGEALAEIVQRLPANQGLADARSIEDAKWRAVALARVAHRLMAERQPGVLDEALSAARGIDDVRSRAQALAEVAQWLHADFQADVPDEALSAARGIDDGGWRAEALAEVADRVPAEERLGVLGEALGAACGIYYAGSRAAALAGVAQRLASGRISESSRHQWVAATRVLALRKRSDILGDFAAMLSFIRALGGETAVRSLGRSIGSVCTWWP